MVALLNGFGGAASALVALSETWKYIEDSAVVPEGLTLQVIMLAAGLSALVGWMTLTGSILAMFKLKGGIEVFGKWFSTPTWGPSWLNPVKVLLTLSVLALIVMAIIALFEVGGFSGLGANMDVATTSFLGIDKIGVVPALSLAVRTESPSLAISSMAGLMVSLSDFAASACISRMDSRMASFSLP